MASGRRFSRRGISVMVLLLLVPLATSCTTWRAQVKPVREVVERHPSATLRVHRSGEEALIVYAAQIRGDSLVGTTADRSTRVVASADRRDPARFREVPNQSVVIPVDSIAQVDVQGFSRGKTVGLILVTPVMFLGFIIAVTAITGNLHWGN